MKVNCNVEIIVEENGKFEVITGHNLVTDIGLNRIANYIIAAKRINRIAVGSGSTPAQVTDTALENQIGIYNIIDSTVSGNVATMISIVPLGDLVGQIIREVALVDDDAFRVARFILPAAITKTNQKAVQCTWSLIFERR